MTLKLQNNYHIVNDNLPNLFGIYRFIAQHIGKQNIHNIANHQYIELYNETAFDCYIGSYMKKKNNDM